MSDARKSDSLAEVRDHFRKAEVRLDSNDVWAIQGTPVVKHRALERLAAALKIKFEKPDVLRHERDEAVLLVSGSLGDASEWSIGEAVVNVNYRVSGKMAAYVYAMAEKRAKDRVIIKLANLHGVYSEEEAEEFKEPPVAAPIQRGSTTITTGPVKGDLISKIRDLLKELGRDEASLLTWAQVEAIEDIPSDRLREIKATLESAKRNRSAA